MANWRETMEETERKCREREVPMLGQERAELLAKLIEEKKPGLVVECGTAIGYSGLWILHQLRENGLGRMITLERNPDSAAEAREAFEKAGLADLVEQKIGDAKETILEITDGVDFLLLDNGYANYLPCFQGIESRLTDGAILLADNAGIGADEMKDYLDLVRSRYSSETIWFDLDLPWSPRDAMELATYRR